MAAFVDTSALFALLDRDDPQHVRAAEAMRRLAGREDLLTHGYVVSETLALTQRRLGADAVRALVDKLLPALTTLTVDEHAHATGIAALVAALPTSVSFVDFVSFQVMRDHSLTRAFAYDEDFAVAGFTLIA